MPASSTLEDMDPHTEQTGYFLFSLDTELGWGFFDFDHARSRLFSPDGSREREKIECLLDVFDEFGITATWAITGHLFYKECEECEICPILEWEGKYQSFKEIYKTNNPLWYGADIIETLLTRRTRHEIGFHGYTHQIFDENKMSTDQARFEVREWLRVSNPYGIVPQTVIFPRNVIGHLDIFQELGFICYRGKESLPKLYQQKNFGKLIKHIDQILSLSSPHIYKLSDCKIDGLVNLSSSHEFFGFNRSLELVLDSLHLPYIRLRRMANAVKKAASKNKVIHVCAHPWEFRTEKDIEKLHYLLSKVSEEISNGRLVSIGMAELAKNVQKNSN
jgi:peptidoglycan/xylan/chitin deacetylase (PgdA/CDA1 family)